MIIDHIAYRCKDRFKTAKLLMQLFDYKVQAEFKLKFDDGSTADCLALEPIYRQMVTLDSDEAVVKNPYQPEFFVSDGAPSSIVDNWLNSKGIVSGIHHIALRVADMDKAIADWKACGGSFTTDKAIECPEEGLVQIFTTEVPEVGHIYEFIQRTGHGFCANSVKKLMESSVEHKPSPDLDMLYQFKYRTGEKNDL